MRIAFIGAGSVVFTRKLLGDILAFPELREVTFALHDIDAERLRTAGAIARRTAELQGAAATRVEEHLDRRAAIDGADFVVNMIQVGGHEATLADFEVPRAAGLRQTIADTLGIGGIFRTLRTFPVVEGIARDIHELAPDAWLLNYTNPMAMLCQATYLATPVQRVVGLCHSVQYTVRELAGIVGVPEHEVTFLSAGINHQAFLLRFEHEGADLYPRLQDAVERDPELARRVRFAVWQRFGYFPTESSEHLSEYVPWFLHHDEEIERYRIPVDEYVRRSQANLVEYERVRDIVQRGEAFDPSEQSVEYASEIIHSMVTGTPRVFYGNVRNTGLIENLPRDLCVEVPCLVDDSGVQPVHVGGLPPQLAALNRTFANVVELTVRAIAEQNVDHVRHAAYLDPNTAATLPLERIDRLVDELVVAHGERLPDWLHGRRVKQTTGEHACTGSR